MVSACSAYPTTIIQHFFRSPVVDGGATSTTSTTDQNRPLAAMPSTSQPAATPASSGSSTALTPADDG
jgi:hypothetical protein